MHCHRNSMNSSLTDTEWILSLYAYPSAVPTPNVLKKFHDEILNFLSTIDQVPTYVGVDGEGYSSKYSKIGRAAYKRLITTSFEGVSGFSILVNPAGSGEPVFDRYIVFSIGYDNNDELLLYLHVNEGFIKFESQEFLNIFAKILNLYDWVFGLAFVDKVSRDPDLHVIGASNGKLSPEEDAALDKWYEATPVERATKFRGVYPISILNGDQLKQPVSPNQTLAEFINQQPTHTLVQNGKLCVWKIPTDDIERTRRELHNSTALIS